MRFSQLRQANLMRLPQFRNARGGLAHSEPDGSDWTLSQWANAVLGELGEAANLIKKIERGDFTLEEASAELGKELADVQTYLDILALRAGRDLGADTLAKFNEVSRRVGAHTLIAEDGEPIKRVLWRTHFDDEKPEHDGTLAGIAFYLADQRGIALGDTVEILKIEVLADRTAEQEAAGGSWSFDPPLPADAGVMAWTEGRLGWDAEDIFTVENFDAEAAQCELDGEGPLHGLNVLRERPVLFELAGSARLHGFKLIPVGVE